MSPKGVKGAGISPGVVFLAFLLLCGISSQGSMLKKDPGLIAQTLRGLWGGKEGKEVVSNV
jgi:hypothetical protein